MKNLSLILFLCIVCFFSCKKENQTTIAQLQIPQLLDRPEKLKYFNEWSETRNQYADLKYKLSKDPEAIEALLQIANLYTSEARITGEHGHYYNAALAMINHALEVKTITKDQTFLALSAKAGVKLSLHSFDEALHLAQQAVLLNPYNAQIYGALVDAYVELGQYEKAIEMADKMVSIRPDLRSYSRVSYLREIYGMPDAAMDAMKMAVEAGSPGSDEKSWAALQLAELCIRYNKIPEAEHILLNVISERPDYPFAKAALAEVYYKQQKFTEAKKELTEACEIIPELGFFIQLAEIYKQEGEKNLLNETLDKIFEMLKDDTDHGHDMSLEYAQIYLDFYNDPDQSLKYLEKDLKIRPENIDINKILTEIYLMKKDKDRALQYFVKASITNSKHPVLMELEREINQI